MAMLCECIGKITAQMFPGWYRILRYHSIYFLFVQLKHKIFWKPADVSFYLFAECNEILNYNIKKLEVNLCCEGTEFSLNIYSFSSFLLNPTLLRGVCGGFSNFFRYSNMRAMSSS